MYRKGGTFISKDKYLKESGLTESQLKFAVDNIVNPATNKNGALLKKDKKAVAELFNKFIEKKDNIPDKYDLKINIKSMRSIGALSGKDIFVFYKGKEWKFTYNDFIYFSAQLLERTPGSFYAAMTASIDEKKNEAIINLS